MLCCEQAADTLDITLVKNPPLLQKNRQAQLSEFMKEGSLERVKSTVDLVIARALDSNEVLGRRGFDKVELIEKL